MGDVLSFDGKKLDDEANAILENFLKPEHSGNIDDAGDTGEQATETQADNLIRLPKTSWPPINWDEVENIRMAEYPRIPQKALAIIRDTFENPGDQSFFEFHDFEDEPYPPDPIPLRPVQGDAVWMIDLLDRYGGEVRHGKQRCTIKRTKKKPALFLMQPISMITRDALIEEAGLGSLFEHFLQSKSWTIWGKEITAKMMVLIINNRNDEDRVYLGWLDRKTAWVLFRRMEDISIERVLGLE